MTALPQPAEMPRQKRGFTHIKLHTLEPQPMGRPKTKKAKLAQLKQSDMLLMLWGTDYMPLIHAMLQRDETLTSLVVNYLHSNKSRYAPLGDVETLGALRVVVHTKSPSTC